MKRRVLTAFVGALVLATMTALASAAPGAPQRPATQSQQQPTETARPAHATETAAPADTNKAGRHEHRGPNGEIDENVCSDAVPVGVAHCNAHVRKDDVARNNKPHPGRSTAGPGSGLGNGGAYDPAYLQSAYNAQSATGGAGQTVAIVDAFDDPNAYADMTYYRSHFGLPQCTTDTGCFRKVDQRGGSQYPTPDTGWAGEIALDLQMVSAMCPKCDIVLVEADSNYFNDLGTAVNTAVNVFHANVVSNSYGGNEYNGEGSDGAAYFNHPGVAITVSSGDNGYGVEFPAASRYVTAVGGTSLIQNTNTGTRNGSETAWSGAGSGCSAYELKPTWQHDTGCTRRTVADVSAIADPSTGVWVYDSYNSPPGWYIYGGTSVAAPIIGAIYALSNNPASSDTMSSYPYTKLASNAAALNDVTSGSNGSCGSTYLCKAVAGYDGPTGLGTPNATQAFTGSPPPPPTQPGPPQSLVAAAGDTKVTLSWSPPLTNGGAAVTSYNVYRSTSSGTETLLTALGNVLTYPDTSVTNGTLYFYKVTAVNSAGEGALSSETTATPQTVSAPSAPSGPSAVAANTRVTLSWSPPSVNGGSPVTSYSVYRGTTPSGETAYVSGITTTSYADTGVANGTQYYYKITALNTAGEGPQSTEVSATPATVPGAPSLSARSATSKGVTLTWSAPSNGGSAITGYRIYRSRSSSSQSYYLTVTCSTTTCSYTDTNTWRGYTYYYRVAATSAIGTGPMSNRASARAT